MIQIRSSSDWLKKTTGRFWSGLVKVRSWLRIRTFGTSVLQRRKHQEQTKVRTSNRTRPDRPGSSCNTHVDQQGAAALVQAGKPNMFDQILFWFWSIWTRLLSLKIQVAAVIIPVQIQNHLWANRPEGGSDLSGWILVQFWGLKSFRYPNDFGNGSGSVLDLNRTPDWPGQLYFVSQWGHEVTVTSVAGRLAGLRRGFVFCRPSWHHPKRSNRTEPPPSAQQNLNWVIWWSFRGYCEFNRLVILFASVFKEPNRKQNRHPIDGFWAY